jgi:hypothetical protein
MAKYQKLEVSETQDTQDTLVVDTSRDRAVGRLLQGRPTLIDDAIGERLMAEGLAAKTDEGWVRGWKWHNTYGG